MGLYALVIFATLVSLNGAHVARADEPDVGLPDLDVVLDKTRGIGDDERDAYFQLLDHAAQGDYKQQFALAERNLAIFEQRFYDNQKQALKAGPNLPRYRFSLYADLLKDPQAYRGQLLPLRGHVRRLEEMRLIDGDDDLGVAYQAYLFTDDSRTHPYIVVSREVPPGMPRGGDILEEVAVAGYFFKIYAYDAQDAVRIAPLLIAQRLEWFPRREAGPFVSPFWGGLAATGALLILVTLLWRIAAKDRRVRQERLRKMADTAAPFSPPES
jgi:hypothetical protein